MIQLLPLGLGGSIASCMSPDCFMVFADVVDLLAAIRARHVAWVTRLQPSYSNRSKPGGYQSVLQSTTIIMTAASTSGAAGPPLTSPSVSVKILRRPFINLPLSMVVLLLVRPCRYPWYRPGYRAIPAVGTNTAGPLRRPYH